MLLDGVFDKMLQQFTVYFAEKETRMQSMLMCSFHERINWIETGLGIVALQYKKVGVMKANNLSEVFNKLKVLKYDKRKKENIRTISIGDVICVADQAWIITSSGFQKIPAYLWQKVNKK